MENTRLKNVCDGILQRWDSGKIIQETQVRIMEEEILNILLMKNIEKLPDSYTNLYRKLKEMWHFHAFDNMKEENLFLLGGVWNSMELLEVKCQKRKESLSIEDLAIKYDKYIWFFVALDKHPGLKHAELARKGKKTPSELSQFISRISNENLYYDNRIGREKYYYLTERGEELLKEIKKKHTKENVFEVGLNGKKIDEKNTISFNIYMPMLGEYVEKNLHDRSTISHMYKHVPKRGYGFGMINQSGEEEKKWQNTAKSIFENSMNKYAYLVETK